jgi:hypothetical protein
MRNERGGGGGVCLELVEKVNGVDARTEHGARSTDGGQGIPILIKRLRIS